MGIKKSLILFTNKRTQEILNEFKWTNDVGLKNKYLLPISLGKYYILKKTLNEK